MNKSREDQGGLKKETRTNIMKVGDLRETLDELEKRGIPQKQEDFEELRDEIEILLNHLLEEEKMDLESSHLIRKKLQRINDLFEEMREEGHYGGDHPKKQLNFDKEKQDSKLHMVQLMLSQIFPHLKKAI